MRVEMSSIPREIIGALLACGVPAAEAAAAGAWLHGRAAMRAPDRGMVASDIAPHLPAVLAELDHIVEVAE